MAGMTLQQFLYLRDLKRLDDIQLGMLAPSVEILRPEKVRSQCVDRGWIRLEVDEVRIYTYVPVAYLTTSGLRAWQRQRILRRDRNTKYLGDHDASR